MSGYILSGLLLTIDAFCIYGLSESIVTTLVLTALIASYPLLWGKPLTLFRMRAKVIAQNAGYSPINNKIISNFEYVKNQAVNKNKLLKFSKVYMTEDEDINAYAVGFNSIIVTKGSAQYLDPMTFRAVLAHEFGHCACGHPLLLLTLTANLVAILIMLTMMHFIFIIALTFVVIVLIAFTGRKGIYIKTRISSLCFKFINKSASCLKLVIYASLQAIVMAISRYDEYIADRFACELGYAIYLKMFLERFVDETNKKTLLEVIYNTHPKKQKRIKNIENTIQKLPMNL